jgi:hypothetical protein
VLSEEWYQHGLGTLQWKLDLVVLLFGFLFCSDTNIIWWGHIVKGRPQPNWINPTLAKHLHQNLFYSQPPHRHRPPGSSPFPEPPSFFLTRVWIVTAINFRCVPNVDSSWQCLNRWHLFMYPKFVLSRMAFRKFFHLCVLKFPMMVLIGSVKNWWVPVSFDSLNMSSSQGRKKWRLPYVSMCELVKCFVMCQKIPFFALANHIMYVS